MTDPLGRTVVASLAGAALIAGCAHRANRAPAGALKAGSAVTVTQPIAIADLERDPASFLGQTVRLEGTVSKVCQGMGCWVEVTGSDGGKFLARSLDESVLVPVDCAGRRIVVQGTVVALPPREEEAKAAEAEGHECPQPTYMVSTQGLELYGAAPPRPQAM